MRHFSVTLMLVCSAVVSACSATAGRADPTSADCAWVAYRAQLLEEEATLHSEFPGRPDDPQAKGITVSPTIRQIDAQDSALLRDLLSARGARVVLPIKGVPDEWLAVTDAAAAPQSRVGLVFLLRFDRSWFVREYLSPVGVLVDSELIGSVDELFARAKKGK